MIIDAAVEEFARDGYQGATIARIARSAKCSEPNLYKHFRDKRDLLLASLAATEARVERELDEILEHPDRLRRFLHFVDTSTGYRRMLQLRMLCSTVPDDTHLVEHLRNGTQRLLDRFEAGIRKGQAAGRIRPDAQVEEVAWSWLSISLASCYAAALHGEEAFAKVMSIGRRMLIDALDAADVDD